MKERKTTQPKASSKPKLKAKNEVGGAFVRKPLTRHDTPPAFTTPIKKAGPFKPPLVDYQPDYAYGTVLMLVNGVPISFKKLPELRAAKTNTRRKPSDDDFDEEGY